MNYSAVISVKLTCERVSVCASLCASWSCSSSSVSMATRQRERRPPSPSTHIPLPFRLCNQGCCRPAPPPLSVLPAAGALKKSQRPSLSWSIGTGTRSGVRGHGWGRKRMTAEVSTSPIPVCLPRWSEELLVLVVERRRSRARVHVRLQMGP